MERFELIAPCHFGLEAVLKREITELGYEISEVEDGRVSFYGDAQAVCQANMFLRTAERVSPRQGASGQLPLRSYLTRRKRFPGRRTYRRMGNSGWRRLRL